MDDKKCPYQSVIEYYILKHVLPGVMSGTKGLKYHHASRNRVGNLKVKLVGSRYDVENSVSLVLLCVVLLFSEFFNLSSLLFNMI